VYNGSQSICSCCCAIQISSDLTLPWNHLILVLAAAWSLAPVSVLNNVSAVAIFWYSTAGQCHSGDLRWGLHLLRVTGSRATASETVTCHWYLYQLESSARFERLNKYRIVWSIRHVIDLTIDQQLTSVSVTCGYGSDFSARYRYISISYRCRIISMINWCLHVLQQILQVLLLGCKSLLTSSGAGRNVGTPSGGSPQRHFVLWCSGLRRETE